MQTQRTGRRLRAAAWVLIPLGLVLLLGAIGGIGRAGGGLDGWRITVAGEAMRPTYRPDEQVTIERIGQGELRRGDVVLIDVPGRYGGAPVLQRVIGLGGDRVESLDGTRVTVNGRQIDEPYVMRDRFGRAGAQYEVTVPERRLFLLGDNRASANDSRYFLSEQAGSVAVSDVRGRVPEARAVPPTVLAAGAVGLLLTLVGTGFGIAGYVAGRRSGEAGAAML